MTGSQKSHEESKSYEIKLLFQSYIMFHCVFPNLEKCMNYICCIVYLKRKGKKRKGNRERTLQQCSSVLEEV